MATEINANGRIRDHRGRFIKTSKAVVLAEPEMEAVNRAMAMLETDNMFLVERLENVSLMLDEKGWAPLYDTDADGGLTLGQLHSASEQLRELVVGNPIVGRGAELHIIYVFGGGVDLTGVGAKGKAKPFTAEIQKKLENGRNRRTFLTAVAQEKLERAAYTDGNVFVLGNESFGTASLVPIKEIQGDLRNPEDHSEIWAFRRVWTEDPNATQPLYRVQWIYTDDFDNYSGQQRKSTIRYGGKDEPVANQRTMIHLKFNEQIGWAYGVPDALSIVAWARLYREFVLNGYVMSKALARIAFKIISKSANGASAAAVQVSRPGEAGGSASLVEGQSIDALSSAGQGYDFDSGRAIVAHIAAGLGVSLVALLGDAGAAKGSSSTEQTLDGPTQASSAMRRRLWESHFERILEWLGNRYGLRAVWHDLPVEQIQRRMQAWTQVHNTGLFSADVVQQGIADTLQIAEPGAVPDGYLLQNNRKSLPLKNIDTDGQPGSGGAPSGGATGAGGSTAGTGQGQGGNGSTGNDHSTD